MDTKIVSTITSHGAGYIDQPLEKIVGLQTDKPLKRSLQPFGGIRMAEGACKSYGYEVDPEISEIFTKYRKTQNDNHGKRRYQTIFLNRIYRREVAKRN